MARSVGIPGVIAAAFLLLHLPFLPASLEDLDSINFALGVRHFDVAQHQPHPPGYPLLILAAKGLRLAVPSETDALSVLSLISGALAILALAVFVRRLERDRGDDRDPRLGRPAILTAALTATMPLYWFTAARPLSDMPGLAAALGVQALTLSVRTGGGLALAALLAGLAGGIRSQVLWLTVPLILLMIVRRPRAERVQDALLALAALAAGGLVWFVPLVWLTGGPLGYWRALSFQGSADLTGVAMLWTTLTPHQLRLAFNSVLVAPWGTPILAGVALALSVMGALSLLWGSRPTLVTLIAAFAPYLVFDLLFQETVTTRYTLPLVVPLAYLVVRGAVLLPRRLAPVVVVALMAVSLAVAVPSLHAYAGLEAPAFRLLKDMRAASPVLGAPPVFVAHVREEFDLRRAIEWTAEDMPTFSQHLPATPKHEWLELVKYWNVGGRAPIWFVTDPLRSDLALIDHQPPRGSYRWPLAFPILLGGVRPNEMDWYTIESPAWYLGEGWALTPETAGIADTSDYGRRRRPSYGWLRRPSTPVTMMIGGRNFAGDGSTASLHVRVDGRTAGEFTAAPGFFLHMLTLAPGALSGEGDYGALTIETRGDVAIEQFDAQESGRVVFGYADGWQESEYDPSTGRVWRWMSERAALRVRGTGQPLVLNLEGETETFSTPSHVTVRIGDRIVAQQEAGPRFSIRVNIPPGLARPRGDAGDTHDLQEITIETDQVYIPADRNAGTADKRHLGLKVFDCWIRPS